VEDECHESCSRGTKADCIHKRGWFIWQCPGLRRDKLAQQSDKLLASAVPLCGRSLDYPDAGFPAKLFEGGLSFETYNVRDLMLINVGAQRPASPTVQLELWEHWHLNPYKGTDIMKNFLKKRAEATPEEWHQMRHPPEYQFKERKLGFHAVDDSSEEEEEEDSESESEKRRHRRNKKMLAPLSLR